MARTKTAPEPVVEDNGDRDWSNLKDKDTSWMHEAFSEFIKEEAGINVPAKHVQAVTAMRVAFRQSDTYLDAKEENKKEQEEAPEPAPKARRSRAAKAEPETETEAPKPTRSRRTRKGVTEPTVTVGKDEKPTRTRRSRRTAKPATDEPSTTPEAPF